MSYTPAQDNPYPSPPPPTEENGGQSGNRPPQLNKTVASRRSGIPATLHPANDRQFKVADVQVVDYNQDDSENLANVNEPEEDGAGYPDDEEALDDEERVSGDRGLEDEDDLEDEDYFEEARGTPNRVVVFDVNVGRYMAAPPSMSLLGSLSGEALALFRGLDHDFIERPLYESDHDTLDSLRVQHSGSSSLESSVYTLPTTNGMSEAQDFASLGAWAGE